MQILKLFRDVTKVVSATGVKVTSKSGRQLSARKVRKAEKKLGHSIPEQLLELYSQIGDGFWFHWSLDEKTGCEDGPFGRVDFPSIKELTALNLGLRSFSTEWDSSYKYPHVDDSELALKTAARMREWLAFHEEGNGDNFSLDMSGDRCPVVFNKHDWLDGGSGFNGAVLGENLSCFMENWASVCFQVPLSLWWESPVVDGVLDWSSDQFSGEYRLL